MFDYIILDEWKHDLELHKNDKIDFTLTLPYDTPKDVYDIIANLLKVGKFLYKLTKGERVKLITPSWCCTSYTDVVRYLCAHERKNGILWNIIAREPEAVAIERALLEEEMRKDRAYETEEAFAAGEGFRVDDDGNWKPVGD